MEEKNKNKGNSWVVLLVIVLIIALGFFAFYNKGTLKKALGFATVYDSQGQTAVNNGWLIATGSYAWGENVGWVDFAPVNGGTYIADNALWGYAYGENIGWISLNCGNTDTCVGGSGAGPKVDYKVTNDAAGHLSGYAWGENVGWINFGTTTGSYEVTISATGTFSGYAWGENIGWINFNTNLTSSWRPYALRTCTGPDSTVIANGGSKTYYQVSWIKAPASCISQSRVCTDYVLSGSYTYPSCVVGPKGAGVKPVATSTASTTQPVTPIASSTPTTTAPILPPVTPVIPAPAATGTLTPINTITLPVIIPKPLVLPQMPQFGASSSTSNGSFFNFEPQVTNFIFSTIPNSIMSLLSKTPALKTYLMSNGITQTQGLAVLARNPMPLPVQNGIPGLFSVSNNNKVLPTYLTNDSQGDLSQLVRVASGTPIIISLMSVTTGNVFGTWNNGKTSQFVQDGKNVVAKVIMTTAGEYILKTSASPLPLVVEVIPTFNSNQVNQSGSSWFSQILGWFNI